jgi:hypothetical protein
LLLILSAACTGERGSTELEPGDLHDPVLLIGVDGLEWRILFEMLGEGELPILKRLMEAGTFGKLQTMTPTWSPVIWTTVVTGKIAHKHGIMDFTKLVDGERQLYTNRDRRTKALWNIFSDYDRVVHSVGWWMTFPAEGIHGTMVAQTNTMAQLPQNGTGIRKGTVVRGLPGQVTPESLHERVMDIGAEVQDRLPELTRQTFGEFRYPLRGSAAQKWQNSLWAFRADTIYSRVATEVLSESGQPFDLMLVYFGGPDVVGHRFWHYAYPEEFAHPPLETERESFSRVIRDTYAYVDAAIGRLLDAVEGNPTVFIVSDHGMHAANQEREFPLRRELYSGDHVDAPPGVLIASGRHVRRSPTAPNARATPDELPMMGRVLDVATTILALKGLPLGRDMDGVVLEDILEEGFLENHPPTYVETHDTPEWLASRPQELLSREAEQERLDQLRSLGYLQ